MNSIPTYSAGEASLKVVPDARNFIRDLEADLKRRQAEFAVKVTADTTRAAADIDRMRAEQERRPVKLRAEVDKSSLEQIKKGLGDAGTALGGALKTSGIFALVGQLPAAATAITNVAGALQQLAGAGAVLPAVFAGVAADVGTVKLALLGVGDAFKAVEKASDGSAKNIQAANEALAKLAPDAAEFVKSVEGLHPAFTSLQKDVQGKFFAGLGEEIKTLARVDLPVLQKGLGGIADALNQNLKQVGASLSSGSSQGLLDRILGNTGDAQARLSKAIDPIIHAFGTLAATGSDTLPRLADGVGKLADRFDQFITSAADSGKLTKWIDDGITGFDHLGNTVLNLGKSFTAITQAAGGDGGLLKLLDEGSQKLSAFLNSAQGQDTLRRFFAEGREEIKQLVPILENLGPIAQGAFSAARDAAGIWLPVLKDVTDTLARNPELVRAIADAFLAWKFVGVITGVADAVKGVVTALGLVGPAAATAGTAGAAGLAPLAAALAPIAALAASVLAVTGGRPQDYVGLGPKSPGSAVQHGDWGSAAFGDAWPTIRDTFDQSPPPQPPPKLGPPSPPTVGPPKPPPSNVVAPDDLGGLLGNGHAAGGVLPGYSPGKDNMLVPMSGGEGVIVPQVARAIGPAGIDAINRGDFAPLAEIATNPRDTRWGWGPRDPHGRNPTRSDVPGHGITGGPSWGIGGSAGRDDIKFPWEPRPGPYEKNRRGVKGFAGGGIVDEHGNPVTPGPPPGGPAPIAAAPGGDNLGGINNIVGSFTSGLQGPIGNAISLGSSLAQQGSGSGGSGGGGIADRFAQVPGIAGLIGSAASSDPSSALTNWGQQTASWLGNFTAKTAGSFGTALWQGALGLVGLDNSILSPTNPWFQAGQQGISGVFDGLNGLTGSGGSGSSGTPSDTDLAALQQSGVGHLASDRASATRGDGQFPYVPGTTVLPAKGKPGQPGYTSPIRTSTASTGKGSTQWRPLVEQIVAARGLGPGWVDPLLRQIQTESGGNPGSINSNDPNGRGGIQTVQGLFNFLPSTFSGSGGKNIWDPADQINTAITYVQGKYGQSGGVPNWIGVPGRGFATGGPTPPGRSTPYPAMLHGDEYVISARGRASVPDSFLHALNAGQLRGFADGGPPTAYIAPPPPPNVPNAHYIAPQPAPRPVAPTPQPSAPAPQQQPAAQAPAAQVPQAPPQPSPTQAPPPGQRVAPEAKAPSNESLNHNLPAISTGIKSAASAMGQAASTAIGIASSLAGSSGFAPGAGAIGAIGPYVAGLFTQGGMIVDNAVNVGSSFLVGNVTPGTEPNAYGDTLRPQQNVPQTAPLDSSRTYIFHGVDSRNIVDTMRMKDAQDAQATLARYA